MTLSHPTRSVLRKHPVRESEQGYMLLTAIFFLALMVIGLTVATPKIIKSIQRDKDLETYHRGLQYRRAIQLYYRKFHAYPPTADALVNTNDIKFLRKKYIDPVTGKDDWKPVLFGQNKAPAAMGFFGQPLGGTTIAGIGPSGGNGLGGAGTIGSNPAYGGTSTSNFGATGGGGFLSSPSDSNSGATGATGTSGSTTDPNNPGGSGGSTTGQTSTFGSGNGQTFGGAGVIGFSPASPKQAILVYKKKTHYNEWEFTYDPISDMQTIGGGNAGMLGQQGGINGLNGQQNPGAFGQQPGMNFGGQQPPTGGPNGPSFGGSNPTPPSNSGPP